MIIGSVLDANEDKQVGYRWVNYSMAMLNFTGLIILIGWSYKDRAKLNANKRTD